MGVDENSFFREATKRVCGNLDIETALFRSLRYLERFMPVSQLYLDLYDPDEGTALTLATATHDWVKRPNKTYHLPEEARRIVGNGIREHQGVRIYDRLQFDPQTRVKLDLPQEVDCSFMSLPLRTEEGKVGLLTLQAVGKDRYREHHAHLLSLLYDPFAIAFSNVLRYEELLKLKDTLADDKQYLSQELLHLSGGDVVGREHGLRSVMELVRQVAPLDSPVLLLGETGVGKDVLASVIHHSSSHREGPFIKVNCGGFPEGLIDTELFGHEKGAFTGAAAQRRGRFERAHQGTIFLDEIAELPPQAQVRLLRVVQHKEIERVGGSTPFEVDVRIISATNRNLEEMVGSGQFRTDLWFRLNVFPILIPPLRQRKEDIPLLVKYFVEKKSRDLKLGTIPEVAPEAMGRLKAYHWSGNVRELENLVERELIQSRRRVQSDALTFENLPSRSHEDAPWPRLGQGDHVLPLDEAMTKYIERVLELTKGRIYGPGGAAERLRINPSTLRNRMKKLGISRGRGKKSLASGQAG